MSETLDTGDSPYEITTEATTWVKTSDYSWESLDVRLAHKEADPYFVYARFSTEPEDPDAVEWRFPRQLLEEGIQDKDMHLPGTTGIEDVHVSLGLDPQDKSKQAVDIVLGTPERSAFFSFEYDALRGFLDKTHDAATKNQADRASLDLTDDNLLAQEMHTLYKEQGSVVESMMKASLEQRAYIAKQADLFRQAIGQSELGQEKPEQ